MVMGEQTAAGGGNESSPGVGDVRFDGDLLLTYDGASWLPMERAADSGPGSRFRLGLTAQQRGAAVDREQPPDVTETDAAGQ